MRTLCCSGANEMADPEGALGFLRGGARAAHRNVICYDHFYRVMDALVITMREKQRRVLVSLPEDGHEKIVGTLLSRNMKKDIDPDWKIGQAMQSSGSIRRWRCSAMQKHSIAPDLGKTTQDVRLLAE